MHGTPAPVLDDDPALAIARAMALAALHDELVAATSAVRDAAAGVPTTTFDWIGSASLSFAECAASLRRDIVGARDMLATAVQLVAAELA